MPSLKQDTYKVILFLSGCILAFLIAEIVTRIINPATNAVPVIFDLDVGVLNQPGYSGIYNLEGLSHYSINSEGWRDVERRVNKPSGVFRIAIVGDSYIEALQVENNLMLSSQLADMLNSPTEKQKYEVMPFGMSGFDAAQVYLAITKKIIKFQPDLIIYAFVSANDLQDSIREISNVAWKPYFVMDGSNLVLDDSFRKFVYQKNKPWNRAFVLYARKNSRFIEYLMYVIYPRIKSKFAFNKNKKEAGLSSPDELYKKPPENSLYHKAWDINERLMLKMSEFAYNNKSRFMILGVTNFDQVNYPLALKGNYDLYYPEHRLVNFAQHNGLYYLPLAEYFDKISKEKGIVFHGTVNNPSGHWNKYGHYYAALRLNEYLKNNPILLKPLHD